MMMMDGKEDGVVALDTDVMRGNEGHNDDMCHDIDYHHHHSHLSSPYVDYI